MSAKKDNPETLLQQLELLTERDSAEQLQRKLAIQINDLIQSDFEKLVQLLYRIDIDEIKLKMLLRENPGRDAGEMIAALMIERQLQKIKSRWKFRQRDNDIDEQEKW